MEVFGELERLIGELYPYRVPVTLAVLTALALLAALGWRRGWHRYLLATVSRHRLASALVAVVALAVAVPLGDYLVSPLWERTTLDEASPLEAATLAAAPTQVATPPPAATTAASGPGPTQAVASPPAPTATPAFEPRTVAAGEWMGADEFHFGRGRALLIETAPDTYTLRVEDFSVRNGPDLFVYLSEDPEGYGGEVLNLGELKATDGNFNYDVPPGTDISRFRSAIVWCEDFAVLFATATLE